MKIGDNIQTQLRARKMSILELEKKSGLSSTDVRNLLYNKSKNIEKLKAVAKALNVPLTNLLPTTIQSPFQYRTYAVAVKIICHYFALLSIETNKEMFDEYVAQIYNYIIKNQDKSEKELMTYCEGMLQNAIKMGVLLTTNN